MIPPACSIPGSTRTATDCEGLRSCIGLSPRRTADPDSNNDAATNSDTDNSNDDNTATEPTMSDEEDLSHI